MNRLSNATLKSLPTAILCPAYDRSALTPGIVHLGIGAFHRSHMAEYMDAIAAFDPTWGIIGASLRRPDTRDALAPQDYLYSLAVRGGAGTTVKVIGSLLNVLDAASQRDELIRAMTDPRVRIVSLTVTEKGYCHDPATGRLDLTHPDIVHDRANPERPISAIGLLVQALDLRRRAGVKPFTVLCCDNLPSNGETVARVVSDFAALLSPQLAAHIAADVTFPCTMVDRIVPATTDDDRNLVAQALGVQDAWPVVAEPFTQWVVEDRFCNGRPALEKVGVQVVADVKPYEHMKLRMLNGSHSTLAYLGYLSGHQFVSEAVANPALRQVIHGLMTHEAMPTLPPGLGDLAKYRDDLLTRFANPNLKHRTWQIAMDGSQKLPQRLLGTIRDLLAQNQVATHATLGVAAWMRYVTGIDEQGAAIDVKDPMAPRLRSIADKAGPDAQRLALGLLQVKEIFGDDLPAHAAFTAQVTTHLQALLTKGARQTVQNVAGI